MADQLDETRMRAAVEAAYRGPRGANPLVGAVLVAADGTVLAVGHHRGAGNLHAEREALTRIARTAPGMDLSDATLYCSLEPCRHHGRQPPCTEAILSAGVGRVLYGADDPTPDASGGATVLRAEGVDVVAGVLAEECRRINQRWARAQRERRPFVTVHLAQSLDGRIAAADGTSQWITSAASREHTHRIRRRIDAILVGSNTAAVDDPRLTARLPDGTLSEHQPLRCVMGRRPLSEDARLRRGRPEGEGWVQLRTHDPLEALQRLGEIQHEGHPVRHVLIEGGSRVLAAYFAQDLVDEIFAYQAPLILGAGPSSVGDIGVTTLSAARRYAQDPAEGGAVRILDDDVCVHLQPAEDAYVPDSSDAPADQAGAPADRSS
ncbi:bifunctional diaminohydroxyphosphoribosylaminopyrimidine deaminase/5-amino-6-(5-phosphoribosylamino)uracil reductase RibD [Nesterenkonia sp. HG001]|uniref:bifunctional diaminohydroxyphosphoribosylaminopyrimidine deaminase/5-amino-6-(5-phosphoribosylamino)uracil reductase RibD n=1 Tax=Nesterenkonia sp. HG001 TaxID=2983207 RepID=UPI002AC49681|nr:bifunctional diaminohydroxyphosphoribosylaminopyrimidine deaminase/5-amino-6-(5-phosphoribosylamino)uracil reductase RibD [Nesterenkonia sp. HG001]MDZ5075957.1 bifunctional diaminohydroxyphosphoribosylaminopyrimidine deaminase/5-amino-6-(5-phosphoribosylamino)uracil reductase RibD [Nesterenkonia sp. HG001]